MDYNKELISFLISRNKKKSFISSIEAIISGSLEIYEKLQFFSFNFLSQEISKKNIYGDSIKNLDYISNEILLNHLIDSNQFHTIISEEMDNPLYLENSENPKFIIAYDPLDGSSNIKNQQTLGTIFSIYKVLKSKQDIKNFSIQNHICSGYILYSYTLTFILCDKFNSYLFYFDTSRKKFFLSNFQLNIPQNSNIYFINDAYSIFFPYKINQFIYHLKTKNFILRYSGTFISDIHHLILKGGIFIYPPTKKNRKGKLRLLYEIIPVTFLIKKINGDVIFIDLDEDNNITIKDISEIEIKRIDQKYGIAIGSKTLIELLKKYLTNSN